MGGVQFQQHHQQMMNPISRSSLRLRSVLSNCCFFFSTSTKLKLLCSTNSLKTKVTKGASADELKHQWLHSLTCPSSLVNQTDEDGVVSPQWVIGVDPDVSGALAVLKPYDVLGSSAAQVYDSPNVKVLIGNRVRRRMDTKAVVELLRSLSIPTGTTAYIEQSIPYPGDGKQGWWSGGFNYGLWIGVLVASGVSVVPVPSLRWKQEFKLSGNGKTKDDSRALACSLFPSLSSSLKRKKDHGRAEALLIAAYGKGIRLNSESKSLMTIDTDNSTL
ncbi:Holliday junction resolvase MOC1, chloroplastic-like [Bidens hawaiensis]|uniref:Holliday junction resolvase MOC1, chloroplastic-like n=1 Tax=Bidens hawaiensis TaxID=980011 RepID=UPI00404AE6E1